MVNNRSLVIIAALAIAAWVASACFFVVNETQRAVELRFGKVVNQDMAPGLHVKWPVMNTVRLFDGRIQTLENNNEQFTTTGGKSLMVDSYLSWRIVDSGRFYQATNGSMTRAETLISPRMDQSLRTLLGSHDVATVIGEGQGDVMKSALDQLDKSLREELGIGVLDLRLKKVAFPDNITKSVYQRMSAEFTAEARQYRAQGQEQAEHIRAQADRDRVVALAHAQQRAEELKGQGDAEAASIYASAYQQSPEFFRFYRSLEAYRDSFSGKKDVLVLSPKSDFFRYLNSPGGSGRSGGN